ncbi:MAG TPA: class I SAM-dependent methyltransferase [Allosphingosinicella sp.]|jgi:hypothetical protein
MIEKVRTGLWFLRRPSFWPHALALVKRKISLASRHERHRPAAEKWADSRSVSDSQALAALGMVESGHVLPKLGEEDIEEARHRAEKSDVEMGGPGGLELLYAATVLSGAQRVVETGVAYGWSSFVVLSALEKQGSGRLASVDMPYPKLGNEPFVGIVVPEVLRSRWRLIREPDRNGLRKALAAFGGEIDLCHYDSDKSYDGRMFAYPILWDALRPGGVFISDDIQDNFAFRDFFTTNHVEFQIVGSRGKFIGLAKK